MSRWDKPRPADTPWEHRWIWWRRRWVESRIVYHPADAWDVAYGSGKWVYSRHNRPTTQQPPPSWQWRRIVKEDDGEPTTLMMITVICLGVCIVPFFVMWPAMVTSGPLNQPWQVAALAQVVWMSSIISFVFWMGSKK